MTRRDRIGPRAERWRPRTARPATWPVRVAAALALSLTLPAAAPAAETVRLSTKSASPAPDGFAGLCTRYDWACARGTAAAPLTDEQVRQADAVNRAVNARVRQVDDIDQYGREEVWALPTAQGGDCEDIALLKKAELIRRGIAPDRVLLATVLDRRGGNHAVLVLRTEGGDYVLDSLTDRMLLWTKTPYSFLRMQDPRAPGRWTAVLAGGIFNG